MFGACGLLLVELKIRVFERQLENILRCWKLHLKFNGKYFQRCTFKKHRVWCEFLRMLSKIKHKIGILFRSKVNILNHVKLNKSTHLVHSPRLSPMVSCTCVWWLKLHQNACHLFKSFADGAEDISHMMYCVIRDLNLPTCVIVPVASAAVFLCTRRRCIPEASRPADTDSHSHAACDTPAHRVVRVRIRKIAWAL